MPIPDYQTLMLPVLELSAPGEDVRASEAIATLSDSYNLTEEEREEKIPSGYAFTMVNRTHWAITYLVHAGLMRRPRRGHFTITDRGREVLEASPTKIDRAFLMRFPEFVQFVKGTGAKKAGEPPPEITGTPEEEFGLAYAALRDATEADLLERLRTASPEFFERAVIGLLVAMRFGSSSEDASEHLGKSGDGGVDGVIRQDELGLDSIYVQAKRFQEAGTIGSDKVRDFVGALVGKNSTKGVFFTTSTFSQPARDYAATVPHNVVLIDGPGLARLMFDKDVGVRVKDEYPVKAVDELFFEGE